MEPVLTIRVTAAESCAKLAVDGEVDAATAHQLATAVAEAIKSNPQEIELDCAAMSFIDSSGIRVLLDAWEQLKDRATMDIYVTNLQEGPKRILAICGIHDLLTR